MTARSPATEPEFNFRATLKPVTPDATGLRPAQRPSSIASSISTSASSPDADPLKTPSLDPTLIAVRNISPGLLARMKFLNAGLTTASSASAPDVGKIPEDQIRTLDDFHRDRSIKFEIQRRGTAWAGPNAPLVPQLTGESAVAMDHSPPPGFESDRSSFISTSDRVLPSDSEHGDSPGEDTQKYRLPDIHRNKILSPPIVSTANSNSNSEPSRPPTPPPKDTPPTEEASVLDDDNDIDVEAYFKRRHFSRANSIYTLSRASFTNQIQQLTSITLPSASSLSSSISAIPTSTAAGRALYEAAGQIKLWMAKASEVLSGLDAEDDVEWAAAAGREGLAEVDSAIGRFEGLVTVYITAIEELQSRPDISALPAKDLTRLITQMDEVVTNWQKIKQALRGIKNQVEIAMEWEELWNTVLGEIGLEIENLSRLVFEMEERRHRAISDSVAESAEKFDIAELETIVEETPRQPIKPPHNNRFSLPPTFSVVSPISPIPQIEKENSRLLALFAKLQPLRASLDFLPMRLSSFQARASKVFPSACDELVRRKEILEKQEKKLEADADSLREELGEDKWVHSFRQAGSKAIAMYNSLMKSVEKLRQAIDEVDEEKLGSRISTYKDKREHYPPSMKRVLELIDIEMKHRSTVNGEILRIQQDVRQKVADLEQHIKAMDAILHEFTSNRKLRDSVSTVLSARTEQSLTSSALDTPGSSPASSVVLMSRRSSEQGSTAGKTSRQSSGSGTKPSLTKNRRYSSIPSSTNSSTQLPRKSLTASRLDSIPSSIPSSRDISSTPTRSVRSTTPGSDKSTTKPRWNSSTNMRDTIVGHNFKPLSLTTPSPHRKDPALPRSLRSVSSHSAIPVRSPLSRTSALSPPPPARCASTTPANQPPTAKRPSASTIQSPSTPARGKTARGTTPGSSTPASRASASARRVAAVAEGISAEDDAQTSVEESPSVRRHSRPPSASANRRISLLPQPKQRTASGSSIATLTGGVHTRLGSIDEASRPRSSLDAGRSSRSSGRKSSMGVTPMSPDDRPRWR